MPIKYLKLCTTIRGNWPAVGPAIIIFVQITPPANLQSLRLTSSCKDRAVAKYCHMELSVCLLPYQFFCLPCPLSMFHTHKAPSIFSFIFRAQRQTWPFKLFAPPSQAQWQRAQFFGLPCPLSVFHTHKAPSLFSFILRTQRQTWPFKLLAPPSQAQWQRAQFFCHALLPCFTLTKLP